MTDAVDVAIIKRTQDLLGKYVTSPTLTNKLLNKPPFKFLHDVINAVITNTGFLSGLYTDAELSKDTIKDKDAKILFLQKCIDATVLATGEDLTVRPSKIVSGHEADKTNELLQAIAKAVENKTESREAVEKVLAGEKPSKYKGSKEKPKAGTDFPAAAIETSNEDELDRDLLTEEQEGRNSETEKDISGDNNSFTSAINGEVLVLTGEAPEEATTNVRDSTLSVEGPNQSEVITASHVSPGKAISQSKQKKTVTIKAPVKTDLNDTASEKLATDATFSLGKEKVPASHGNTSIRRERVTVAQKTTPGDNSKQQRARPQAAYRVTASQSSNLKDKTESEPKGDGKVVRRSVVRPPGRGVGVPGVESDAHAKVRGKDDKTKTRPKPAEKPSKEEGTKRPSREKKTKDDKEKPSRRRESRDDKPKRNSTSAKPGRSSKEKELPAAAAAAGAATVALVSGAVSPDGAAEEAIEQITDDVVAADLPDPLEVLDAPPEEIVDEIIKEHPIIEDSPIIEDDTIIEDGPVAEDDPVIEDEDEAALGSINVIPDDELNAEPVADHVDDLGIASGGPPSLDGEGARSVSSPTLPPPSAPIDPAILKAMDPEGALEPLDHPDSGVGSIDSPKVSPPPSMSPPAEREGEDGETSFGAPRRGGPMRAVHPDGKATPTPTRPPTSQGYASSRPVTSRGSRPRTARPPSARPAAPRVRERKDTPAEDIFRPPSALPAPTLSALILESSHVEGDGDGEDALGGGDDEFLVTEQSASRGDEDPLNLAGTDDLNMDGADDMEGEGGGGLLMDQILDVKKNLEDGRKAAFSPETPGHRRVNLAAEGLNDASRRKEREAIQQDVSKLASSIQTLTRAVNPLAKMLDYLQEDLDSMQKELLRWRSESKTLRQTLKNEQSNMTSVMEPLTEQLRELDNAIQQQQDRISVVKCSTLRNAARIHSLLAAVSLGEN